MQCRCGERRDRLAAAGKAVRSGRLDVAGREVRAAGRTLSDDAKAFAEALRARLERR